MKNWHALRSWARAVGVVILLAVLAVAIGAVPASARRMIDDDGGGGGGDDGGGGGGDGGVYDCLGDTTGSLWVSPTTVKVGEYTTLHWSVNPAPGCTGMTQSISGDIGPVPRSGSRVVRIISPRSWGLHGQLLGGRRELASTSVAVEIPPTVTITSDNQVSLFLQAITVPGQLIEIQNHVNLDLSYKSNLYIKPGVQIIGGRSPTEPGPRLYTTTFPDRLFLIGGHFEGTEQRHPADNVRISGIRLEGAETGIADSEAPGSTGITVYSSVNIEIDNNELSRWRGAAVDVRDPGFPFPRINGDNYNTVWVHDNFIHHNLHYREEGYGVAVHESAYALIEKNVFDYNRHAITAEGASLTGYYAHRNLVFGNGGLNSGTFNINTHMFDVHGSVSCWGFGLYCGDAGEKFDFRYNTILYDHGTAIKVRGKPARMSVAEYNVFRHPDEWGGYLDDAALVQTAPDENFVSLNNTFGAHFDDMLVPAVPGCDFNGDGAPDDFLATGATWWRRSGASNGDWRYLYTSRKQRNQLTLGNVNGDGVCDVKDDKGLVYLGGVTPPPPSPLPVVPNVKGATVTQASSMLAAAGFTTGTASSVVDPTCNNIGRVASQIPAAGAHAEAGTPVKLSIGQKPQPPAVCK